MLRKMTKSKNSSKTVKLTGSQTPSARIAPQYRESDGDDAAAILRSGGLALDPWQIDILNDWMSLTPSRLWAAKTCGLSVPRQNGKTGLVQGRANSGMILYNEMVIYTAHLQKTATETFEEMAAFFDTPMLSKYIKDIKTALGREQIILKSGARVKFLARTRSGGRGQHGDLLIFDEAQELDDEQQASFLPAISASANPQTILIGTPPEPQSTGTVFRGLRDKALTNQTSTTAWAEFSVAEIGDVKDRSRWAATNPALGLRILESTVEGECEQMPEDTFARERLGWWTPIVEKKIDFAIDKVAWNACASDDLKPEGKTAYGVKFSADASEVVLCGAVCTADGSARVSLIERRGTGQGIRWLADWLNQRADKACCVVIDGRNGVDVLIERISDTWRFKNSVIRPSSRDVVAAASLLVNEVNEQTVSWYSKQDALRDSALSSPKRAIGGGWGFGGSDSAPIEAAALALWGCRNSKRDPSKKMRIG